jgi:hypothetical protein
MTKSGPQANPRINKKVKPIRSITPLLLLFLHLAALGLRLLDDLLL